MSKNVIAGNEDTKVIDSGNTITKTNTETSIKTIDSGNTSTENTSVSKTIDSNNSTDITKTSTENTTKTIDSFNTENKSLTENTTKTIDSFNTSTENITKTIDSYNTTDIGLQLKGLFNDYNNHEGSTVFLPENLSQTIQGGAGDASTMIAMDQVNSLAANDEAEGQKVFNTGDGIFDHNHVGAGEATGIDGSSGASLGNSVSGAASATVTADAHSAMDAFNQSIVVGANTQLNNFSVTVVGHDTFANADHH
jgi:hypothetical protein